jgi:O-methyltransferase
MISGTPFPNECINLGKGEHSFRYKLSLMVKKAAVKLFPGSQIIFPSIAGGLRPSQLYLLMSKIYESPSDKFCIAEVGIARGVSTVFLVEALKASGKSFSYFAIDTFSGFDKKSVLREQSVHGQAYGWDNYDYLDYASYCKSVQIKKLPINLVRHTEYDTILASQAFDLVILDVDTEVATLEYLNFFYPRLNRGGMILVDDASPANKYDGALRAYVGFCERSNIEQIYLRPKSALIYGA